MGRFIPTWKTAPGVGRLKLSHRHVLLLPIMLVSTVKQINLTKEKKKKRNKADVNKGEGKRMK